MPIASFESPLPPRRISPVGESQVSYPLADPLFVDPANADYRLKPDSPAFQLGFQAIDFDRIGPRGGQRPKRSRVEAQDIPKTKGM